MKGPLGNIMQQAQKMQEKVKEAQDEIAKIEIEGVSGGGLVKIKMTAKHEVLNINIDESLLSDDKDMLEDLLVAAFNDCNNKAEQATADRMQSVAGGMGLPAGMKLPF
ncbi:MAG: YbaB/EbfC family nucleoid-associated protein [Gammaproteobacteria bacterium]|nr:MAG: YbaB/EbfC family nucleoid-associated protein [Gammaproteobacteria bacterium]